MKTPLSSSSSRFCWWPSSTGFQIALGRGWCDGKARCKHPVSAPAIPQAQSASAGAASLPQRTAILVFLVALCWWAAAGIQINVQRIGPGLPAIARIFSSMAPDAQWLWPAVEDDGTNVGHRADRHDPRSSARHPGGNPCGPQHRGLPGLSALGRQLSNAIRAFPELVLGVFFVAAYGPGATAGTLALGVHSIGMLASSTPTSWKTSIPGPRKRCWRRVPANCRCFALPSCPRCCPICGRRPLPV